VHQGLALAGHYLDVEQPRRALDVLAGLGGGAPEQLGFWEVRAQALLDLERFDEALQAAEEGLRRDADSLVLLSLAAGRRGPSRPARRRGGAPAGRAEARARVDVPARGVRGPAHARRRTGEGRARAGAGRARRSRRPRRDPGNPNRRLLRQTYSSEGALVHDRLQTPEGVHDRRGSRENGGAPRIDAGLAAFFTGYREALEEGTATVAGSDVVDGRKVQWLRFPPIDEGGLSQEVAVDGETYEPRLLRAVCPECAAPPPTYRIVVLEGVGEHAADFTPPRADPQRAVAYGGGRRQITQTEAESALGRPALWAGPEVGGLQLADVRLVTPTIHSASPPTPENRVAVGRGLQLVYGGEAAEGGARVAIGQAEDYRYLFGSFNLDNAQAGVPLTVGHSGVPPEGEAALTGGGGYRTAQLRKAGLYVEIDGPSRELVLEAARSLRRLGAS
jgi:hypothetical protein